MFVLELTYTAPVERVDALMAEHVYNYHQFRRVSVMQDVYDALKSGTARKVFLADNADPRVTEPVADLCQENGIEAVHVPSMHALGAACGIAVGSAVAAIVE